MQEREGVATTFDPLVELEIGEEIGRIKFPCNVLLSIAIHIFIGL